MIKWQVYEPLRYKYPRCQNYECPTNEQDCHLIGGQCYFFSRQNIDYDAQQSLCATKFGAIKQLGFFVIKFFSFFLFHPFAQRVQTQITKVSTQSVIILNLLWKLIIMLRLPAIQNLDQLEENWLNQVHQQNYIHSFIRQLRQL